MKTKKIYNKKNKTNKNKNIFLNKIKKNTKKRQRKIYKGGIIPSYFEPKFKKKQKEQKESDLINLYSDEYNKDNGDRITFYNNPLHTNKKSDTNNSSEFGIGEEFNTETNNSTVDDYENIYENEQNGNPFFYDKNSKNIEEQKEDFKKFPNDVEIYIDIINTKYNDEDDNKFKNILFKIFKRNFSRILELFDIELYYFLYFKLLEEDKYNVFDLFDSFDQNMSVIKDFCLKKYEKADYRFDFNNISHFFNISKTFIDISLLNRKLFDSVEESKNIIDTFSYSIICININSYIYYNKSYGIGQKLIKNKNVIGGDNRSNLLRFGNFRNLFPNKEGNNKEKEEQSYKTDTIYNFFETPEKKNELKTYFSKNKDRILEKIKEILNNNYLLKIIVFFYINNEKKNKIVIDNSDYPPDGLFETEIKNFKETINEIYYNFLNNFYNEIFSDYKPSDVDKKNFLSKKEKINKSIKKFDEIIKFE
jgi:hypothetical protein